jgi:hypothetical protein
LSTRLDPAEEHIGRHNEMVVLLPTVTVAAVAAAVKKKMELSLDCQ